VNLGLEGGPGQQGQAEDVGDGRSGRSHAGDHLFVGEAELFDELLIGCRLLQDVPRPGAPVAGPVRRPD
jgi:hypothetical protein